MLSCIFTQKIPITSNERNHNLIKRDLQILTNLTDCPHILKCYGFTIYEMNTWIFLELMGSCFGKIVDSLKSPLPEDIIAKVAVSVSII